MIHFGKLTKVILVEVLLLLLFIVPDWLRWFNLFIQISVIPLPCTIIVFSLSVASLEMF